MYTFSDEAIIMAIAVFFLLIIAVFGEAIGRAIFEELRNLYESITLSITSSWRWCLSSAKYSFKWLYDRPLIYCSGMFAIGLWFGKGYFDFFTMIIESARDVPR